MIGRQDMPGATIELRQFLAAAVGCLCFGPDFHFCARSSVFGFYAVPLPP
jgi:hypothetical protein